MTAFFNPWVLLALALGIAGAFGGGYYQGNSAGKQQVQAAWDREKAELNAKAAEAIAAANDKVREVERAAANTLAAVSDDYAKSLRRNADEKNRALANARSNGLFINTKCESNTNAVSGTAASPGGNHAATQTRLPNEASEFLLTLAAEADAITQQLMACQAIVKADRELLRK